MNDLLDINRGGDCWTFTLNRTAKMNALSVQAQKQLYKALDTDLADRDMADLVRSAARPGLKKRISDYLAER
jgi:enoyl-CoA hydratase/carnithine racemase